MKKFGLIGYPLGHSFSKGYFTDKFLREAIEARYDNYELPSISTAPSIWKEDVQVKGLNVTIPYKEQIIPLLDELDPTAQAIGAVNVVRIERTEKGVKSIGFNSDVIGFTRSIAPLLQPLHRHALILGTGGASKAVKYALEQLGLSCRLVSRRGGGEILTYEEITPGVLQSHSVVVNTTPLGMSPRTDAAPDLPYEAFTPQHIAFDLIYNPAETLFLQQAKKRGAIVKNGLDMLHGQAEAAWEIWNR